MASGSDDPGDWEPVDVPTSICPAPVISRWKQLCRLLCLRRCLQGHWHEMGMYLQKLKRRGKIKGPQHVWIIPKGPDGRPPDDDAGVSKVR